MDCLVSLCLVSSMYLTGEIGIQAQPSLFNIDKSMVTNSYGERVGSVSATMEFNNGLFFEYRHISGLSTWEKDYGFNAIMIGAKIYFKGN